MKKDLALDLLEMALDQRDEPAVLATTLIALDRLVARKPEHATAHYASGRLLLLLGRAQLALGAFRTAVARDPKLAPAFYYEGVASWLLGHDGDALEAFDEALVVDPELFEALYDSGQVLSSSGRYEVALDRFERALALRPDDFPALKKRIQCLNALGRYVSASEARAALRARWETATEPAVRAVKSYVFDQFELGPLQVLAVETLDPTGDPRVAQAFPVSWNGQLQFTVNVESSAFLRSEGVACVLTVSDIDTHVNTAVTYAASPPYHLLKPDVKDVIVRYVRLSQR